VIKESTIELEENVNRGWGTSGVVGRKAQTVFEEKESLHHDLSRERGDKKSGLQYEHYSEESANRQNVMR